MVRKVKENNNSVTGECYRAFIAIDLPECVKSFIYETVSPVIRKLKSQVKWVAVENFHLTLRFIGNISIPASDVLREKMRSVVVGYDEMEFEIRSSGVFPSWKEPRVLWIGLNPTRGDLLGLQKKVEEIVQSVGYPPEKQRFHPHITVGRVKNESAYVSRVWGSVEIPPVEPFVISKVTLFRSNLLPTGAVYERVEDFLLGDRRDEI